MATKAVHKGKTAGVPEMDGDLEVGNNVGGGVFLVGRMLTSLGATVTGDSVTAGTAVEGANEVGATVATGAVVMTPVGAVVTGAVVTGAAVIVPSTGAVVTGAVETSPPTGAVVTGFTTGATVAGATVAVGAIGATVAVGAIEATVVGRMAPIGAIVVGALSTIIQVSTRPVSTQVALPREYSVSEKMVSLYKANVQSCPSFFVAYVLEDIISIGICGYAPFVVIAYAGPTTLLSMKQQVSKAMWPPRPAPIIAVTGLYFYVWQVSKRLWAFEALTHIVFFGTYSSGRVSDPVIVSKHGILKSNIFEASHESYHEYFCIRLGR